MHKSETKEIAKALNREFSAVFEEKIEETAPHVQSGVDVDVDDRRGVDDVFCAALHGDMTTSARSTTLDSFRSGRIRVLVCTDVASRGLDMELGNRLMYTFLCNAIKFIVSNFKNSITKVSLSL